MAPDTHLPDSQSDTTTPLGASVNGPLDGLDIDRYLRDQNAKDLLRFITCGSVDDGKSTLIGRLLYDSKMLFDDQLATLESESRKIGTQGGDLDFALLVDGLSAEREQGITIDVAYRFFNTEKRKFIVADTPGHEQYTRNMVTGASTADLAVILIDARRGVLQQTRRHSFLVSLLGIRQVVLAVNKMDLVGYDQAVFDRIVADYRAFARQLDLHDVQAIPLSALRGDNITRASDTMPWYDGPTLIGHLETVTVAQTRTDQPFRLPVQWVNRPNLDFRGFAGTVAGGAVRPGDRVWVLPAGVESRVARVVTHDGDLDQAVTGQAVTLTLEDEVDVSRGDILSSVDQPATVANQLEATLVWLSVDELVPGHPYLLKLGTRTVPATVTALKHKINVNTLEQLSTRTLALNEVGLATLSLNQAIAFDPYRDNRDTGGFILIDRLSNETVGAGLVRSGLHRQTPWQVLDVDRRARSRLKNQRPLVLWFTGLSGAGKSTIANLVERKLHTQGRHTMLLDGDNLRHGLNRDLGFTEADRVENIRRVAEVAKLMVDSGLIVLVSFISPFRADRDLARGLLGPGEFLEIFVDTPLAVAESRDVKGLYARARRGEIANFTGIDSPYEPPVAPEIRINTQAMSAQDAAEHVCDLLDRLGDESLTDGAAI